jgi:hypothetical protein
LLQGEGDTVTAKVLPDQPGTVVIESIVGDDGRLSLNAADNCVGIAAMETLKLLGSPSCGVSLTLHKVGAVWLSQPTRAHWRGGIKAGNCLGTAAMEILKTAGQPFVWCVTHSQHCKDGKQGGVLNPLICVTPAFLPPNHVH